MKESSQKKLIDFRKKKLEGIREWSRTVGKERLDKVTYKVLTEVLNEKEANV